MAEQASFCSECGYRLRSANSSYCSSCGASLSSLGTVSTERPERMSEHDSPKYVFGSDLYNTIDKLAENIEAYFGKSPNFWKIVLGVVVSILFSSLIYAWSSGSGGGPSAESAKCIAAREKLANMPPGSSVPNIYSLVHADYLIAQGDVTIYCD